MPYEPKRPAQDACPVEAVLAMVSGKWKARLLLLLSFGPSGFAPLKRSLPGISQQVLATQLSALVSAGIVERDVMGEREFAPSYALSPRGISLLPVLETIASWGGGLIQERGLKWERPTSVGPSPRGARSRKMRQAEPTV